MFRSLASRLLLTYILVTVLVILLAALSLLVLLSSTPLADRLAWQTLEAEANVLVPRVERAIRQHEVEPLAAVRLAQRLRSRALVVNPRGQILAQGGMSTLEGMDLALAEAALATGPGEGEARVTCW
jgi:hypothetical protein